jgi:hypothetical protein
VAHFFAKVNFRSFGHCLSAQKIMNTGLAVRPDIVHHRLLGGRVTAIGEFAINVNHVTLGLVS